MGSAYSYDTKSGKRWEARYRKPDGKLRVRAAEGTDELRTALLTRLAADRDAGNLPEGIDPAAVVGILTTYMQGFWQVALVDYRPEELRAQVNALLQALGLPIDLPVAAN